VEAYAQSVFNNSEDELHHESVAIHAKNAFVADEDNLKPLATPQEKMFKHEEQPTVLPSKKPSVTADDDKKPTTLLEETV
jgi:hypothetical protein